MHVAPPTILGRITGPIRSPRSPTTLHEALGRLINDPEPRKRMQLENSTSLGQFSPGQVAADCAQALERILACDRQPMSLAAGGSDRNVAPRLTVGPASRPTGAIRILNLPLTR